MPSTFLHVNPNGYWTIDNLLVAANNSYHFRTTIYVFIIIVVVFLELENSEDIVFNHIYNSFDFGPRFLKETIIKVLSSKVMLIIGVLMKLIMLTSWIWLMVLTIVLTNHFKLSYGKSKCLMSFAHCAICISYKIFQGMLVNSYPKDGFHMDSISLFLFALKISNIVMFMNYEPRLWVLPYVSGTLDYIIF